MKLISFDVQLTEGQTCELIGNMCPGNHAVKDISDRLGVRNPNKFSLISELK
jgi:hypothetical protein